MTSTAYLRTVGLDARAATGHRVRGGSWRPVEDYDRSLIGAGAVRSTIADMAAYAQALLRAGAGEGSAAVPASALEEMWSQQYTPDPRIPGIGLAFFLGRIEARRTVGHDGNLPGFASALRLAPDDGLGVVVLPKTATMFGTPLRRVPRYAAGNGRGRLGV